MPKTPHKHPLIWTFITALVILAVCALGAAFYLQSHKPIRGPVVVGTMPVALLPPPTTEAPQQEAITENVSAPVPEPPVIATEATGKEPRIAVVIDDMGLNRKNSTRAVALPGPVTLSYLPYGQDLPAQAEAALRAGHELLLHMPMQPVGGENPGPEALVAGLSDDEIRRRLDEALTSFAGYVGMNNHMGSRATTDRHAMEVVMPVLKEHNLMFLDSRTSEQSIAYEIAKEAGVLTLRRDIFLDNIINESAVLRQLDQTERVARQQGYAIAIGHPHAETLTALEKWIGEVEERGYRLVKLSELLQR